MIEETMEFRQRYYGWADECFSASNECVMIWTFRNKIIDQRGKERKEEKEKKQVVQK